MFLKQREMFLTRARCRSYPGRSGCGRSRCMQGSCAERGSGWCHRCQGKPGHWICGPPGPSRTCAKGSSELQLTIAWRSVQEITFLLLFPIFWYLCDLLVVQVINLKLISLFLYLPPSFLQFLTSRWPLGPSGCWRRAFSSLWWSSSPPAPGCPGSVRSGLAGIGGKRPQKSEPRTYSGKTHTQVCKSATLKSIKKS